MSLLLIIFQIFVRLSIQNSEICENKLQLDKEIEKSINYNTFKNMKLQTILYEKINPSYDEEIQLQLIFQLRYTILPVLENFIFEAVKVQPYAKMIQFDQHTQCNTGLTNYDQFKINLEGFDLILLVQLEYETNQNYLSRSNYCIQDEITKRPLVGYIVINAAKFDTSVSSLQDNIFIILHELTHIMCFDKNLYSSFIDPSTGSVYATPVVQTIDNYNYITTPLVKAEAQAQFDCNSLPGMRLEDAGDQKYALNHWKKSWVNNEYMTFQQTESKMFISRITLFLFDDSGWYQTNKTFAQDIVWGRKKGCDFLDLNNYANYPEYFCNGKKTGCTFDHNSMGYCTPQDSMDGHSIIQQIQNCQRAVTEEQLMNYLTNQIQTIFGWKFQQNAQCFEATNITLKSKYNIDQLFSCYETRCDSNNNFYVTVDGVEQKCEIGKTLQFQTENYHGNLVCPSYSYCPYNQFNFCQDRCNDSGLCLGDNKCICSTKGQYTNCDITLNEFRILGFLIFAIFYIII